VGPFSRKELAGAGVASLLLMAFGVAAVELAGRWAPALIGSALCGVVFLAATLTYHRTDSRIREARALAEAATAIYHTLKPVVPLPLMAEYAIAPDSALLLHELIRRAGPRTVVETGSGVSSLIIGYTLKSLGGGRLIALERDEEHARRTRDAVALHGLGDVVTVAHAPLVEVTVDGATHRWHDARAVDGVDAIDFVFDDGPPIDVGPGLRYAALPLLQSKLSPQAVYLVNFIGDEERTNIARWQARDRAWRVEWRRTVKGNAILRRG
jgi:predicted O-methyltransferase YrrM